MLVPVRGIAVNVGEQTGDGRYIVPGAVTHAELPLPIAWLIDGDQHADFITRDPQIGNMTSISFVDGGVAYQGVIDDDIPEGAEVLRRMREGSAPGGNRFFVSIDPDDWAVQLVDPTGQSDDGLVMLASSGTVAPGERFDWTLPKRSLQRAGMLVAAAGGGDPSDDGGKVLFEDSVDSLVARFTRLRIRGLSMCSVSAFPGSFMELDEASVVGEAETILTTAARFTAKPVHHTATIEGEWDGPGAVATAPAEEETLYYMHAWVDPDGDPDAKSSYKFPHHAPGTDTAANLAGVRNALARLSEADIPDGDRAGVEAHLQAHLDDADAEGDDEGDSVAASSPPVRTEVNLAAPPASWFQDPTLPFATPLTITNQGRILGHVAAWGTCHTGYAERCLMPPRGDYGHFHVGETLCSDGSTAACGVFAWGIPHAGLTLPMLQAYEHYSDSRHGFGRVAVGEDDYGIWFSGALYPGITDNDVAILRALSMSGDWRRDPVSRRLALIAALAVNFPGYPIPRPESITASGGEHVNPLEWELDAPDPFFDIDEHDGEVTALVACGRLQPRAVTADCGCTDTAAAGIAELEARMTRFERLLSPLYGIIAERLDARTARND